MIEAVWGEGFKRLYKKRVKRSAEFKSRFWKRMDLFLSDPFSSQLRTHKLSGKLQGLWAFSIDDDYKGRPVKGRRSADLKNRALPENGQQFNIVNNGGRPSRWAVESANQRVPTCQKEV